MLILKFLISFTIILLLSNNKTIAQLRIIKSKIEKKARKEISILSILFTENLVFGKESWINNSFIKLLRALEEFMVFYKCRVNDQLGVKLVSHSVEFCFDASLRESLIECLIENIAPLHHSNIRILTNLFLLNKESDVEKHFVDTYLFVC